MNDPTISIGGEGLSALFALMIERDDLLKERDTLVELVKDMVDALENIATRYPPYVSVKLLTHARDILSRSEDSDASEEPEGEADA